ncbi:MAG: AAC(3) family N-acetyltransferase [Gemmatimonadota bacterium]|nr:AAC(3) family N-acetyltransferase [Gemmatimonadota bacterium]
MTIAAMIGQLIAQMGGGPVFTHSDPFRAARLVAPSRDRVAYLDAHLTLLRDSTADRGLWIPTFNYEFPKTRSFDVARSPSELGPLPERFRTHAAAWRTPVPIFSIAGIGAQPRVAWAEETDPFGNESIFAQLVANDGVVLYYGETFHYSTLVHYAERMRGGPPYRYDMIFPGTVVTADGTVVAGSLIYHVRPLGTGLEYDWAGMLASALESGVCRRLDEHPGVLAASARGICDLWGEWMRRDPLALLDSRTRTWVEPALEDLGRGFLIGDFESPEPARAVAF